MSKATLLKWGQLMGKEYGAYAAWIICGDSGHISTRRTGRAVMNEQYKSWRVWRIMSPWSWNGPMMALMGGKDI